MHNLNAPFAVFLFAIQLRSDELKLTLPIAIAIGTISGVIGVLNLAGDYNNSLYLYEVSNRDSAIGLFANRNHSAVFSVCLVPMLAMFAAKSHNGMNKRSNIIKITVVTIISFIIILVLFNGSRSGVVTAVLGIFSWIYIVYISY